MVRRYRRRRPSRPRIRPGLEGLRRLFTRRFTARAGPACINAWGIDPAIVNRHGGAIAMGHPLGAGQGLAVVLENVSAG